MNLDREDLPNAMEGQVNFLTEVLKKRGKQIQALEKDRILLRKQLEEMVKVYKAPVDETTEKELEWDAYNYFDDLPNEMVDMILYKLKDQPKVLALCCDAWERFRVILEPRKSVWLFPEILTILLTEDYITKPELLKCRTVCRGWKEEVTNMITEFNYNYKHDDSKWDPKTTIKLKQAFKRNTYTVALWSAAEIIQFIDTMEGPPHNPLFARSIDLSTSETTRDPDFWSQVINLLQLFGNQIWEFKLVLDGATSPMYFVRNLRNCLVHLPQLRKLNVTVFTFRENEVEMTDNELIDFLRDNPFPDLPHLREVYLFDGSNWFLRAAPLMYWQTLVTIDVGKQFIYNMLINHQDKLRNGALGNIKVMNVSELWHGWNDRLNLDLMTFPLEELSFSVMHDGTDIRSYKKFLERFGGSLKKLRFSRMLPGGAFDINHANLDSTLMLNLPFLETLNMMNPRGSLNWLLSLESLRVLKITFGGLLLEPAQNVSLEQFSLPMAGEIIQIHGFVEKMYESNIWLLIPSLEEINFSGFPTNAGPRQKFAYSRKDLTRQAAS